MPFSPDQIAGALSDMTVPTREFSLQGVREVGPYRLGIHIGRGGSSDVRTARKVGTSTNLVLKGYPHNYPIELFRNEVIAHQTFSDHPNVVSYVDHGTYDVVLDGASQPFSMQSLITERPDGMSLVPYVAQRIPSPIRFVSSVVQDAASALTTIHGEGLIHKDVKPGNILLNKGTAQFIDFGSVAPDPYRTTGQYVEGTFAYVAPELFHGRATHRSDVYALALTALDMFGRKARNEMKTMSYYVFAQAPDLHDAYIKTEVGLWAPRRVRRPLLAALQYDDSRRTDSAAAFAADFAACAQEKPLRRRIFTPR